MACVGVAAVGRRHGDQARRELRAGIELPEGRRVTALTSSVRSQLMSAFNAWLRDAGLSFEDVFLASLPNLDRENDVLVFGGEALSSFFGDDQLCQCEASFAATFSAASLGLVRHVDIFGTM